MNWVFCVYSKIKRHDIITAFVKLAMLADIIHHLDKHGKASSLWAVSTLGLRLAVLGGRGGGVG